MTVMVFLTKACFGGWHQPPEWTCEAAVGGYVIKCVGYDRGMAQKWARHGGMARFLRNTGSDSHSTSGPGRAMTNLSTVNLNGGWN
jgi:hypothetical protein